MAYNARVEKRFMTRKVTATCFRTRLLLLPTPSNRSPTHIPILFIGDKIQGCLLSACLFPSRLTPLKACRKSTGSLITCVCTVHFSQGSKGHPLFSQRTQVFYSAQCCILVIREGEECMAYPGLVSFSRSQSGRVSQPLRLYIMVPILRQDAV